MPTHVVYLLSHLTLLQEKELVERHNVWLNDELTAKVGSIIELRRHHSDKEAELSAKLRDVCGFAGNYIPCFTKYLNVNAYPTIHFCYFIDSRLRDSWMNAPVP